jgi:hypothetical protein
MAGMRPDEAKQFYEDDEDPAKVFAIFDAAKQEGQLGRTEPPELQPLRQLLADLARELWRDLRELRIRERIALRLERAASAIRSHTRVH